MDEGAIRRAIGALRAGQPVLLPTDTVYGLAAGAAREDHAASVYKLKGRVDTQPTALVTASVDALVEWLPELGGREEAIVRALLPGPFTLIVSNPAQRFRWLAGPRADALGVRVPTLPEPSRQVVEAVGCIVATSANEPGGPDPVALEDVPPRIRAGVGAELDAGPLPGTPSTVIDVTGPEPSVLRAGAVPAEEAIARVRAAY